HATVGGGESNFSQGEAATVPGGDFNAAVGNHSFSAGHRAKANHAGTFVWGDETDGDFASTGDNQLLIRASGGGGICTNSPKAALHVNGTVRASAFETESGPLGPGTSSSQPLEFKINGTRALRLELNGTGGVPNVIGGSPINSVAPSVIGATIGGGGGAS